MIHAVVSNWVLCYIWGKEIIGLINIMAELKIVDFSHISLVEVFSNENLEQIFARWKDIAFFKDSSELLGGNVATLGSVIILELWLDQDSLIFNF